jgi:hypothetical protein
MAPMPVAMPPTAMISVRNVSNARYLLLIPEGTACA